MAPPLLASPLLLPALTTPQETTRQAVEAAGASNAAAAAGEAALTTAERHRREVEVMKSKAVSVVKLAKRHEATLDTITSLYMHCLSSDVYSRACNRVQQLMHAGNVTVYVCDGNVTLLALRSRR